MLAEFGLEPMERRLPSDDIHELRQQLADQLDMAGIDFANSNRRTIVVVDGLDHVERDYPSTDNLLAELPRPAELPAGVLFVVGSRTLVPLPSHARQQVDERQAVVDLEQHRLSPATILDLCRRAPVTSDLAEPVHQKIAELTSGHPLALGYLLNRLRDVDPGQAEDVLATAPSYEGDIGAEYRAVWDSIEDDDDLVEILAMCSRLRVGFTSDWLGSWAPSSAVRAFRRKLLYLFRRHHDGLHFFHDSFRQFAADRTAVGDDRQADARQDALAHGRVADLCADTTHHSIGAEELYHRYSAGQHNEALDLAQQRSFREQSRQLRSPELIRSDITLALGVAAERADVVAMLRLLLALIEMTERTSNLEDVDVPGLLFDAGLVDEAISYCGGESRRVPLAHAYDLAARLGLADDPAGKRIFDLIEHDGIDDPHRMRVSGREDDAAVAWTRAAALFRPLPRVLANVRRFTLDRARNEPDDWYARAEVWRRYERMLIVLVGALAGKNDVSGLDTIEEALANHVTELRDEAPEAGNDESGDGASANMARLIKVRLRLIRAQLRLAASAEEAQRYLDRVSSTLRGVPLFHETMLEAAEVLAHYGRVEQAEELLDHTEYEKALTVHDLSSLGESGVVDRRFRYWRLQILLKAVDDDLPESVQPGADTPAGDEVAPEASLHRDNDAIELATRIDVAIRTLARVDAATAAGDELSVTDAWATLVPLLDTFRPAAQHSSATLGGMAQKKPDLMRLIVTVAINHSKDLAQRLKNTLTSRFREQPDRWSLNLRLDLAADLRSGGVDAPWYQETLAEAEAQAATEDVYSRLEVTADLVRRYSRDGDLVTARRLVLTLIPMALGVGYRKDYQFDLWVEWLSRALSQPDGNHLLGDAAWLARVLTAVDPMTEGAPGSAAVGLPPAIAPVAPLAAVRSFEYLIRHGTVHHPDALAALIRALVKGSSADDLATIELAADITADLLAPAANRAYPELASTLIAVAGPSHRGRSAPNLAESIASRTDMYALATSREEWREGLGLHVEEGERTMGEGAGSSADEYGALTLADGRMIARDDVASLVHNVSDIINLRHQEADDSSFSWGRIIDGLALTNDDIQSLVGLFDESSDRHGEVLASLAAAAERNGDVDRALRLAYEVLGRTSGNAWSRQYGGARLRAAAIAVRLGGSDATADMCHDLAHQVTTDRWLAGTLLYEIDKIVESLAPDLDPKSTWPEIRVYLEGLVETVDLPDAGVFDDHGCRWWLLPPTGDQRANTDRSTTATAMAEVAVGHLSHPTWLVREAATRSVVRALTDGNEEVADALGRFAQPTASDDTLERAGRCLAAAQVHDEYLVPDALQSLELTLARHRSQVLRNLTTSPGSPGFRPLPPTYRLSLPPPSHTPIGSEPVFLAPHEGQYRMLADGLDLDSDTMLAIAGQYATTALSVLPDQDEVRAALKSSRMQHTYPSEKIAASRAAFGRVLADLTDAQLLDGAPQQVRERLRTVDVELPHRAPGPRPNVVPRPPPAGHDQTLNRWRSELDRRLEEYVVASRSQHSLLIAAKSRLTVLNWGHMEEEFVCGTTIGSDLYSEHLFLRRHSMLLADLVDTSVRRDPEAGEPLVIENIGHTLHQIQADWLAFRPDIATTLQWIPDEHEPGRWHTVAGELAVETIWWVDGWWGRAGPAFDDTEADGYAVVLSSAGMTDMAAAFESAVTHFSLARRGRSDNGEAESVSADRSIEVIG